MSLANRFERMLGFGEPRLGRLQAWLILATFGSLVIALLGNVSSFVAHLSLLALPLVVVVAACAACIALIGVLSRAFSTALRMLTTVLIASVVVPLIVRVVFGTPWWVKHRAAPAIVAIVTHAGNGPYPRGQFDQQGSDDEVISSAALSDDVLQAVRAADCAYSSAADGRSFSLTCRGVMFTHCTYEHGTQSWRAWN